MIRRFSGTIWKDDVMHFDEIFKFQDFSFSATSLIGRSSTVFKSHKVHSM